MREYKPRKGFFDISDCPKGLSKVKHRKMQETQTLLQRTEDRKEYYLKYDRHSWEVAKEMSAQLQQLIFKYYPKILVEELEE